MPSTGAPNDETVPVVGRMRPAARLSSVDLPPPVGPTIATNSPGATDSETASTATYAPAPETGNRLVTSTNSSAFTCRVYAPPESKSSDGAACLTTQEVNRQETETGSAQSRPPPVGFDLD